jgi:hypothetical protein
VQQRRAVPLVVGSVLVGCGRTPVPRTRCDGPCSGPRWVAGSVQSIQRMAPPRCRRPGRRSLRAHPRTRTGELCGRYPRGRAGTAHLSPLGQWARSPSPAGPVRTQWGPHALTTPIDDSQTSRLLMGGAVPRALPHDPCGHPGNAGRVVHGQSWCEGRHSVRRFPPQGGCAVVPLSLAPVVGTEGVPRPRRFVRWTFGPDRFLPGAPVVGTEGGPRMPSSVGGDDREPDFSFSVFFSMRSKKCRKSSLSTLLAPLGRPRPSNTAPPRASTQRAKPLAGSGLHAPLTVVWGPPDSQGPSMTGWRFDGRFGFLLIFFLCIRKTLSTVIPS